MWGVKLYQKLQLKAVGQSAFNSIFQTFYSFLSRLFVIPIALKSFSDTLIIIYQIYC